MGNQQRRGGGNRQSNQKSGNVQAGTGAFLDNTRLRGDEIDVKDQQDFDFGAAKNEFDLNDADKNAAHGLIVGNIEKTEDETVVVDDEETKQSDNKEENKKYDASKSFFDGLETETKKSKPRQDTQTQKEVDTSTFGSVAATYKSRHINKSGGYRQGNRNNYYRQNNNNQGYNQNQRRNNRSYNRSQQQTQSNGYGGNRWVKRG